MTTIDAGRFAPSPSGDLHLGNLRTALLAWLFARSQRRPFFIRIEDLDDHLPSEIAHRQLDDLSAIGLDWDGEVVFQSQRRARYDEMIDALEQRGLVYECYCSRREIQEAPRAPHAPEGAYPGTCRDLTDSERMARRQERPAASRLLAAVDTFSVLDDVHGEFAGVVDDFVLRRGDGTPAYNLAVVVDDHEQGVGQVVRGDDLLASSPRQAFLATVLGWRVPRYAHIPLALNVRGERLAKRDGAVTLSELGEAGLTPTDVVRVLAHSLGFESASASEILECFEPNRVPRGPWIVDPRFDSGPDLPLGVTRW